MSVLTSLALLVTSGLSRKAESESKPKPEKQSFEIAELQFQIAGLMIQIESLKLDRDFYRSRAFMPSPQYMQAAQALQRVSQQAAGLSALGAIGMQAQQDMGQIRFCNCVPARQDFFR